MVSFKLVLCALLFCWCIAALPVDMEQRYCGRRLVYALRLICNNRYRRAVSYFSHEANTEESDVRRVTRGVVDECCRRRCSISVLATYCAPPLFDVTSTFFPDLDYYSTAY